MQNERIAPLPIERVRQVQDLTRNGPDVVSLAQEVEQAREEIARLRAVIAKVAKLMEPRRLSDQYCWSPMDAMYASLIAIAAPQPDPPFTAHLAKCISDQMDRDDELLAENDAEIARLREALKPFAEHFQRMHGSDDYSYMQERIKDWFGVSDFASAQTLLSAQPEPPVIPESLRAITPERRDAFVAAFNGMTGAEAIAAVKRLRGGAK